MDYENDTDFLWPNGSSLVTITSKDDTRREPNPFSEFVAADMQTALRRTPSLSSTATVTNPLDEHQQRVEDRKEGAKCRSRTKSRHAQRQYVSKTRYLEEHLKEVAGRFKSGWSTGPEAKPPEDITTRTALHQRYLAPIIMTLHQ